MQNCARNILSLMIEYTSLSRTGLEIELKHVLHQRFKAGSDNEL